LAAITAHRLWNDVGDQLALLCGHAGREPYLWPCFVRHSHGGGLPVAPGALATGGVAGDRSGSNDLDGHIVSAHHLVQLLSTVWGGEFELKVKFSGDYRTRFDQSGLMLRIDHENYIKTGIEFVDGKYNLSTVVTHHTSDWSIIPLDKPVPFVWIKAVRRLDAVEIFYSFDDKEYTMMRNAWLQDNHPVKVGVMGACPDGDGFTARFEDFTIKHLPDARRVEWLKKNSQEN